MPRNQKARQEFFTNYVNILFMVLSLIQGLAFQDVGQNARDAISALWGHGGGRVDWVLGTREAWVVIAHTVVALAVLIRVLQTYITVALDYGPKYVTLTDILAVFLVGFIELFVFKEFKIVDNNIAGKFLPDHFWLAMFYLSVFAGFIYIRNAWFMHLSVPEFPSKREENEERKLQYVNAGWMLALAATSLFSWYLLTSVQGLDWLPFAASAVATAILATTTAVSLSKTFGIFTYYTDTPDQSQTVLAEPISKGAASVVFNPAYVRENMNARPPVEGDIDFIVQSVVRKYGELFSSIFGVSEERLPRLVAEFVRTDDKRSPLSWRYWVMVSCAVGLGREAKTAVVGGVLVHSGPSYNCLVTKGLGHSAGRPSVLERLTASLMPNKGAQVTAFDDGIMLDQLGKDGLRHLKDRLSAFQGTEVRADEARIRLLVTDPGASEDGVADCVIECLLGGGFLDGELLRMDHGLQRALQGRGFVNLEVTRTEILVGGEKVSQYVWKLPT